MRIMVVTEHEGGSLKRHSAQLCAAAAGIAGDKGETAAFVCGPLECDLVNELGRSGADRVFSVRIDSKNARMALALAEPFSRAIEGFAPDCVLGSATPLGSDLIARVAMRFKVSAATDCTSMTAGDAGIEFMRPVYGGNAMASVRFAKTPGFATVRPNALPSVQAFDKSPSSEILEAKGFPGAEMERVEESEPGMLDIAEADRIVAAGRGVGSVAGFGVIRELADALGAAVGASRGAVDAGFISHDHQVGQSGRMVNPTLYIACGISGSIQHISGMRTSRVIVAINRDPEAPIFNRADYGIVGDMFEVVPALTESIKELESH